MKIVPRPQCFTQFVKFWVTTLDVILFSPIPDCLQCLPDLHFMQVGWLEVASDNYGTPEVSKFNGRKTLQSLKYY